MSFLLVSLGIKFIVCVLILISISIAVCTYLQNCTVNCVHCSTLCRYTKYTNAIERAQTLLKVILNVRPTWIRCIRSHIHTLTHIHTYYEHKATIKTSSNKFAHIFFVFTRSHSETMIVERMIEGCFVYVFCYMVYHIHAKLLPSMYLCVCIKRKKIHTQNNERNGKNGKDNENFIKNVFCELIYSCCQFYLNTYIFHTFFLSPFR